MALASVKDGPKNLIFEVWPITVLKLPSQYFPWGGGGAAATYMGAAATYMGGGWGKFEINAISAQHSWNWA